MSDSKAVKALKLQHKQELADGVTTIKKFKDWQAALVVLSTPIDIDQIKLPTIDETIALAATALEAVDAAKVVVAAAVKVSKASLAEAIFKEALNSKTGLVRKDVLALFQVKAVDGGPELSEKGANTYFHNLKSKYGLVEHKAA